MLLFLYNYLILVVIGLSVGIEPVWLVMLFFFIIYSIHSLLVKQNVEHIIVRISFGVSLFLSLFFLFGAGFLHSLLFTLSFIILFWSNIRNNKQKALIGGLIVLFCLSVSGLAISYLMSGLYMTIVILLILIESHTIKAALSRITICITATFMGTFVYIMIPAFLTLCKHLVFVLFTGAAFATGPLVTKGVNMLLNSQTKEGEKKEASEDIVGVFLNDEAGNSDPVLGSYLLFGGIAAVLIILLSYRLHKQKNQSIAINTQPARNPKLVPLPDEKIPQKPPHHSIRKNVFEWEKKLAAPFARRKAEGFSEWVLRLSSERKDSKDRLVGVYQAVRYGNGQVSKEEIKEFKREFEELAATLNKKQMKKKPNREER